MSDTSSTENGIAVRRFGRLKVAGLIAAGVLAGGIAASTIGANAATTPSSTSTSPSSSSSAPASGTASSGSASTTGRPGGAPQNLHGSAPVRSDEKAVSAADAATLKAAALKAVPGGTVYRIETDAGDGSFEAHMTKADGTEVTVKFDKNLAVTKVEAGMGTGDPAPAGN
jgi:hypothetical protein